MARLSLVFNVLIILLSVIATTTYGDQPHPSYSECKPLIDATIMDLAAKAIHAGEQPSGEGEKPCPSAQPYARDETPAPSQETSPPPPPPPHPSSEEAQSHHKPAEEVEGHDRKAERENVESTDEGLTDRRQAPSEEPSVPVEQVTPEQYVPPPPQPAEAPAPPPPQPVEAPAPPVQPVQAPSPPPQPAEVPPPPPQPVQAPAPPPQYAQAPAPPPQAAQVPPSAQVPPREQLGVIEKFLNTVFGLPKVVERDPKFSRPWNTHPEFQKKAKPVEETPKKMDPSYGFVGDAINKFVDKIFKIPEGERDPKWTQPWQTHKEHIKPVGEASDKPKEPRPSLFNLEFVNKFVAVIFGKDTIGTRDPKWAKPWTTHEEHKKVKALPEGEKPKVPVQTGKGGMINSLVSLVFEIPKEERDPKWAKPWQTHPEHKKSAAGAAKPETPEGERVKVGEAGPLGQAINKLIFKLFGETTGERNPKYAKPWQTHEEYKKSPPAEKAPGVKVEKSDFFGISKVINKFVEALFGKVDIERDPKWSKPWQTHEKPFSSQKAHMPVPSPPTPAPQAAPAPPPPTPAPTPAPQAAPAPPPPTPAPQAAPAPPPTPAPQAAPAPPPTPAPQAAPAPPPTPAPQAAPAPPPTPAPQAPPAPPPTPAPEAAPAPPPPQKKPEPEEPETKPKEVPAPAPVKEEPPKEKKEETFPSDSRDGEKAEARAAPDRVVSAPEAPVKQVLEEVAPKKEQAKEKIVEAEEQIVVVPSAFRPRDHIESILGLDDASSMSLARTDQIADSTLKDLKKIYDDAVKPLESTFKYQDISNRHMSDAELFGTPMVLLLGPYSTGKSTFINYLLGTEFTKRALRTGTPPSHGVFRIIKYGNHDRDLDGTDLSGHWSFSSLQKFGQNFVDQIQGREINTPLLKKMTFVEAPGILEMRRPGERIYPFNDVVQWFIDRADLILIMFDYTKLDAGYEMEAILDQLKGRESQTRILLNKADQVPPEELIKVQGSLFWNLSPLLGVSSPPVVYAGSFSSLPYRIGSPAKLFQAQEEALLHDIAKAISSRVDNRIAIVRRHAVRVRNHAKMVDTYLTTFYKNKGFLTSKHKLAEEIIENPHAYNIYEGVSLLTNISRYDLPDAEIYRDFFRIHNLYNFKSLRETCSYLSGCPLDKLDGAINKKLPELMTKYRRLVEAAVPGASLPEANIRPSGMGGANVAHAHHHHPKA